MRGITMQNQTLELFSHDCVEWRGYVPCESKKQGLTKSCVACNYYSPIKVNSLIIEAGGLGSILRTTPVAREILKQFPFAQVQWLTHSQGAELLANVPSVHKAIIANGEHHSILQAQSFNAVYNFDHDPKFLALMTSLDAQNKFGFTMTRFGKLAASEPRACEMLRLQTDDQYRRRVNSKYMQQILLETGGFEWKEQEYDLVTKRSDDEWAQRLLYKSGVFADGARQKIVGLNIGSSRKHNAKRWSPENFYILAEDFGRRRPDIKFVVLAGPDDHDAYQEIVCRQQSEPLDNLFLLGDSQSISQFISLVGKLSLVVSADTFGFHVAVGLRKPTIVLCGPQPYGELSLYGRGTAIHTGLECSPCFASQVDRCTNSEPLACMKGITVQAVVRELEKRLPLLDIQLRFTS